MALEHERAPAAAGQQVRRGRGLHQQRADVEGRGGFLLAKVLFPSVGCSWKQVVEADRACHCLCDLLQQIC